MFYYMKANTTAGYSGYVVYDRNGASAYSHGDSVWMIPGTFFDDWDNQ